MIMTAVAMFTVMDSIAKYLSRFYPVPGIVWARYAFHLLFVVMILGPRMKLGLVRTRHPGLQIARGVVLAASSMLFFSALKFMPMAEASSISFVAPMLVTLLAVFLLKERSNRRDGWRWRHSPAC
jgi:drug/metabolite transporter (DMT)-like permease